MNASLLGSDHLTGHLSSNFKSVATHANTIHKTFLISQYIIMSNPFFFFFFTTIKLHPSNDF